MLCVVGFGGCRLRGGLVCRDCGLGLWVLRFGGLITVFGVLVYWLGGVSWVSLWLEWLVLLFCVCCSLCFEFGVDLAMFVS